MTAKRENRNSPEASGDSPMPAKAMAPMMVAPKGGTCVLRAASCAASAAGRPLRISTCMPSALTMALSTTLPMAMIRAPRRMRSTLMPKSTVKKKGKTTVSASVTPTTTAARAPMKRAIITPTDSARLIRKALLASSTTTCC